MSVRPQDAGSDTALTGLTEAEAAARRAAGRGNVVPLKIGRSYGQIVRENVFNTINNILFMLGVILLALGRYLDAVIAVGVVVANTVVSLVQEIRAKRTLDRIAILTRPKAIVIREGATREVDPSEIVLGDLLRVEAGDQIVVDGSMVGPGRMEMDESLLTGESDVVRREAGDQLYSGSFVAGGGGHYIAEKVGMDSFANQLTTGAQAFRRVLTPLQKKVNTIVRALLLLVVYFEILVVVKSLVDSIPFVETVRMSTVIVAMVPNGLILSIAVAYALGALRMAGKGALIQQANSVESLSHVDVLCTDKTGTLTTNNITVSEVVALNGDSNTVERLLGDYAATTGGPNRTTEALERAFTGTNRSLTDEVLFSSALKWSAVAFNDGPDAGVYVFGAPEAVRALLGDDRDLVSHEEMVKRWTSRGLRVLLLAGRRGAVSLHDGSDSVTLPPDLAPLALICMSDELRPKVQETLDGFRRAGVQVKVISGDNPQTVAALAKQAGFEDEITALSGADLEGLSKAQLGELAEEATVFGRVTPQQKEQLVEALRERGHYVAMIGDGVNDVISLKKANVAIAMQSGTQAARSVADMILTQDSFGALPFAFREGQRIVNGMVDILRIFMVRIVSKALLVASVMLVGGFPFFPRQASLLSFFAAGVPAVALAYWAPSGLRHGSGLMRSIFMFAAPAGVLMSLMGLGVYLGYLYPAVDAYVGTHPGVSSVEAVQAALPIATSATTVFAIFCSVILLPLTVPPTRFWTGGSELRGDWRPTFLAVGLLVLFGVVVAIPFGRLIWDITLFPWYGWPALAAAAVLWALALRGAWRGQLVERFLGWRPAE
ncbi:MAG: HAD-IC family P-type ATPase [Actinobacteria bacterium]|nr:HAD-IC family P-type ATPase [Actinomycetota bacterium]